jgi:predicted enzyme related to lactoylglutathione lyase
MTNEDFQVARITLAVTNTEQMVAFYRQVYSCIFKEVNAFGTVLYSGKIGDMELLLCPNSIAGVKADQNRHQLEFVVSDLDSLTRDAKAAGGTLQGEIVENAGQRIATVVDPDGNTTIFIQKREL